MEIKKRILIAPLNWGLGHATRCIPIIKALIECDFEPIIASDGEALRLLEKEFSEIETISLPAYKIKYAKKGKNFKLKLLKDSPKILKAIKSEKKYIKDIIKNHNIDGVISDNRLGVHSKKVPSVFISHQLNVLSGNTTWLSTKIHQLIIKKFDECWVPDVENEPSLSGRLGHVTKFSIPIKYLGVVSRFEKRKLQYKNDLMVLLSGPEPQRTMLEELLLKELKNYQGNILFVRGVIEATKTKKQLDNIKVCNFMTSTKLENALNESKVVLSRSGYTTVMDLAKLGKRAFFIPTPGQFEQEYLAERLDKKNIIPTCSQDNFTIKELDRVSSYLGFKKIKSETNFEELFNLFKGK